MVGLQYLVVFVYLVHIFVYLVHILILRILDMFFFFNKYSLSKPKILHQNALHI